MGGKKDWRGWISDWEGNLQLEQVWGLCLFRYSTHVSGAIISFWAPWRREKCLDASNLLQCLEPSREQRNGYVTVILGSMGHMAWGDWIQGGFLRKNLPQLSLTRCNFPVPTPQFKLHVPAERIFQNASQYTSLPLLKLFHGPHNLLRK